MNVPIATTGISLEEEVKPLNDMKKIALVFVCLNPQYWPYLKDVIEDCKKYFLTKHQVDFFVWSDMPEMGSEELNKLLDTLPTDEHVNEMQRQAQTLEIVKMNLKKLSEGAQITAKMLVNPNMKQFAENAEAMSQFIDAVHASEDVKKWGKETILKSVEWLRNEKNITIIPTDSVPWPQPTLMRYHLFLQEEEKLRDYDYIFYLDADMRVVDTIDDEILGKGLTAAEHPMYALRKQYVPPYEPNKESTAYIPRPGSVVTDSGVPRFKPIYAAGGFQGGVATEFIKAMKQMRDNINKDMARNYIAIWNDESHWNKYLFGYEGFLIVLTPSYIYPDSLIENYYEPLWGCKYRPKIVTLTKKFTLSKEGGDAVHAMMNEMKNI